MEENTNKPYRKSYDWLKQYQFQAGNNANPNGRPKGKSLKTFVKETLEAMTDEEKAKYLKEIDPEMVWKMAEGNPQTNTDITSNGKTIILPAELIDKNDPDARLNQTT